MIEISIGRAPTGYEAWLPQLISAAEIFLLSVTAYFAYLSLNTWRSQQKFERTQAIHEELLVSCAVCIGKISEARQAGVASTERLPEDADEWDEERRVDYLEYIFASEVLENSRDEFEKLKVAITKSRVFFSTEIVVAAERILSLRDTIIFHSQALAEAVRSGTVSTDADDSRSFCFRLAFDDEVEQEMEASFRVIVTQTN